MPEQTHPRTFDLTDPAALRALAHPLRGKLLAALRIDGPATASMLARRYGESSGATSYHLRQLARYGFIEDDASRGWRPRALVAGLTRANGLVDRSLQRGRAGRGRGAPAVRPARRCRLLALARRLDR